MTTSTFSAPDASLVNTTTDGFQTLNNVYVTPYGGYTVVWSTAAGMPGNVTTEWFQQSYDGAGLRIGGETSIANPPDAPPVSDSQHQVALSDGSSVRLTGESMGMFSAQLFDSGGNAAGEPLLVAGASKGWSYAATLLPDGNVAVVFQPVGGTGPGEIFSAVLDRTSPPPDAMFGTAGDDHFTGTGALDTAVIAASLSSVQAYSSNDGVITVTTSVGTDTLTGIERVHLDDAIFATDTRGPDGDAWQAAALFRAGTGSLPSMHELSLWTSQAEHASSMGALAQQMIDFYAPGVSTAALVTDVYVQLVHETPSADTVQSFVDQVGAGKTFETQGDLLAYAANLSLNTDQMVGFVGSVQQLDPGFF